MTAPDLRSLRYFVAVAEARSVGKAAIRLNMAQPPLSVHIKNLEAALGTPLFRRAAHGMEITDAGSALLTRAREALLLAHEGFDAARAIGSGRRGRIAVGTMFVLSYLLLPRLSEQLRQHLPDVEVQYVELNAVNSVPALIDSTVTVAFCLPPLVHPGILVERMGSQRLMLAVRSDSPFARMARVPVARLAGVPLIGLPVPEGNAELSVVTSMLRRHDVIMPVVQRGRDGHVGTRARAGRQGMRDPSCMRAAGTSPRHRVQARSGRRCGHGHRSLLAQHTEQSSR